VAVFMYEQSGVERFESFAFSLRHVRPDVLWFRDVADVCADAESDVEDPFPGPFSRSTPQQPRLALDGAAAPDELATAARRAPTITTPNASRIRVRARDHRVMGLSEERDALVGAFLGSETAILAPYGSWIARPRRWRVTRRSTRTPQRTVQRAGSGSPRSQDTWSEAIVLRGALTAQRWRLAASEVGCRVPPASVKSSNLVIATAFQRLALRVPWSTQRSATALAAGNERVAGPEIDNRCGQQPSVPRT
jgi:hypothetical protein